MALCEAPLSSMTFGFTPTAATKTDKSGLRGGWFLNPECLGRGQETVCFTVPQVPENTCQQVLWVACFPSMIGSVPCRLA